MGYIGDTGTSPGQGPRNRTPITGPIIGAIGAIVAAIAATIIGIYLHAGSSNNQSPPLSGATSPSASQDNSSPSSSPTPTANLGPLEVTISSPRTGARLPNNTFGASGIVNNIPAHNGLWLVIKPPGYHRWYPVSPAAITGDIWSVGSDKICPAGGRQNIEVFLVPNIASARLKSYVSQRTSQHDPGINSMHTLATPEATSRLHVKYNAITYC